MNNMKILLNSLLALLFIISGTSVHSQDAKAKAILDELSKDMQQYESVSASFKSKMTDKQSATEVKQEGSIKVSGDSYKVVIGDFTVISNGETVWTYSKKSNEVMIDLAEDIYDEEGIEPAELFTIWETGFNNQYVGLETLHGVSCHVIKLFPKDPKEKSFHTIKLYIDKDAMEMKRAVIYGKEGNDIEYDLTSFDVGYINSSEFKFDKTKYPGVEVIDNR
jgi:outer membrane lipoprotein-sorting protein